MIFNGTKKNDGFLKTKKYLLLLFYILFQPLADVLTSLCVRANLSLTVGVVFRMAFMVAAGLYVLFVYRGKGRNWMLGFLLLVLAYCAAFLGVSFLHHGASSLGTQLKGLTKIVYFPVVSLALFALWMQYKRVVSTWALSTVGLIYIAVILLAMVTGTSFNSYMYGAGYNGWFYAANEVGAVLACLCPIVLLWSEQLKGWYKYIPPLIVAFIASYIGTKVVFALIFVYMLLRCGWKLFYAFSQKGKGDVKRWLSAGLAALLCVLTVGIALADSPLSQNLHGFAWHYTQKVPVPETSPTTTVTPPTTTVTTTPPTTASTGTTTATMPDSSTETTTPTVNNTTVSTPRTGLFWRVANWLLSGRLQYLDMYLQEYRHLDFSQILFGMGYVGLPQEHTLELDFIAVFIQNGIFGFLILCLPFFAMLGYMLWFMIRHGRKFFADLSLCTLLYAFLTLFATALLVGHTLVAPAVSLYFPLIFLAFAQTVKNVQGSHLCE